MTDIGDSQFHNGQLGTATGTRRAPIAAVAAASQKISRKTRPMKAQ
jgi:hypothetical protein